MWDLTGDGEGTFYFENFAYVLDHFLVNKNMATEAVPIRALPNTVQIGSPGWWTSGATIPGPLPLEG
jgi:hypothetical protein